MQLKNTAWAYGWVSIVMHWLMALLIFGMFGLGLYMVELGYMDVWYKAAPDLHISVGMVLFSLLLFRLVWRSTNPLPQLYGSRFEKIVGLLVHRLHYIFMFTLMLSGYLIVTADGRAVEIFHVLDVPALLPAEKGREFIAGKVHMLTAWVFIGFIGLHAAAAIKHHVVDKDSTLLRMLGIKKERRL